MGFKSDREFLRNVSIGAVGTRSVATVLQAGGFKIIELERYSASNKIWATKIKRLRVPDLLCLRTGTRIESRGKSSFEITMSHAVSNPERAWDKGLRDSDLVAFVRCWPVDDTWRASDRIALFRVGDMRAQVAQASLSRMKSAAEGSELRLTWPATIPNSSVVSPSCPHLFWRLRVIGVSPRTPNVPHRPCRRFQITSRGDSDKMPSA